MVLDFSGKRIVVGLTGSVAVYKSIDLIRELKRLGARVKVVVSKSALDFVGLKLISFACGEEPLIEVSGGVEHVVLMGFGGEADALIIAPCTANTISKIASGLGDSIVSLFALTGLGAGKPLVLVPAMHLAMFENPFIQKNIELLKKEKVFFVNPLISEGKAKYPVLKEILLVLKKSLTKQELKNKKVLVVSGASQEPIDSIRVISNNASGLTGELIAEQAFIHGASVTLLTSSNYSSNNFKVIKAKSFQEFFKKTINELSKEKFDFVFSPVALNDFKVKNKVNSKISSKKNLKLELVPNKKLIQEIRKKFPKIFLVSFKAEANKSLKELKKLGEKLLKTKTSDLIVLNNFIAFGSKKNNAVIVSKKQAINFNGEKELLAKKLIELIK